ncbi:MAG: hypothetical protein JW966_03135, partial [Anaerolineae bacterium]|nr:hypothetical protein [Anaerolineae bacterium]
MSRPPMIVNSRFSQHARRSLSQARLLAQDYQHESVDTDHLLVGILRETSSLGAKVLTDLEIDGRRAELEVRVLHATVDPLNTIIELTGALERVLTLAAEESRWFGHHYIGTEHLLLALARSREGGASELLRTLAVSPDQIRRRVRLLLNDGLTEISIEAAKRTARLSELSRRVLNGADQLAAKHNRQAASLIDLLAVLASERRSMVSSILRECGLAWDQLEAALARPGADPAPGTTPDQQAALEDVIDHAVDRADQLGTHYTGTDHILLALAQNNEGARLLVRVHVNSEALIAAVYRHLLLP